MIPRHGLLAITATDMPVLCGVYPDVALRKYGGYSMRAPFTHEIAVRLLIGLAYRVAGMNDCTVTPLASLSSDHYVRVWLDLRHEKRGSNLHAKDIGFISYCPECMESLSHGLHERPGELIFGHENGGCRGGIRKAGPLWIGPLFDRDLLGRADRLLNDGDFRFKKRTTHLLRAMIEECDHTERVYIDLHALCHGRGCIPPRTVTVIDALRERGYAASGTHFRSTAIRTDASARVVIGVVRSLSGRGGKNGTTEETPH